MKKVVSLLIAVIKHIILFVELREWSNRNFFQVVEAKGPLTSIYFIVMVFFGSFQLLNTILALINVSYSKELLKQSKAVSKIPTQFYQLNSDI